MQIRKIEVTDLFGLFNHEVRLRDERITIVHGPNGFGKTALFRLVSELFSGNYDYLYETRFKRFVVTFDKGSQLVVQRHDFAQIVEMLSIGESRHLERHNEWHWMLDHLQNENPKAAEVLVVTYDPHPVGNAEGSKATILPHRPLTSTTRHLFSRWVRVLEDDRFVVQSKEGRGKTANLRQSKVGSLKDSQFFGGSSSQEGAQWQQETLAALLNSLVSEQVADWFQELTMSTPVHFISSHRLYNWINGSFWREEHEEDARLSRLDVLERERLERERFEPELAVHVYARTLAQRIKTELSGYANESQVLDRSFPARVLRLHKNAPIIQDDVFERLKESEDHRQRLTSAGLLDAEGEADLLLDSSDVDDVTRRILQLYLEDTEKKLRVLDDLAARLELFQRVINERFSYKKLVVDRKKGFRFTNRAGENLPIERLSTGEQHELVLFYRLLFEIQPNSLVLIDEPEISLHVAWQSAFLADVQDVAQLSTFDILIATHSPQIIGNRWDLTEDLKGPDDH